MGPQGPQGLPGQDGKDGKDGSGGSGIHIGSEPPTDENVNIWINPNGEPSGSTGGNEIVVVDYKVEEPVSVVEIPLDPQMRNVMMNANMICWRLTLFGDETVTDTTGTGTAVMDIGGSWLTIPLLKSLSCVPSAENKSWQVGNVNGYVLKSPKFVKGYIGSATNVKNHCYCIVCSASTKMHYHCTEFDFYSVNVSLRLNTSLPIGTGSRIILTAR
jgi:hypothetical protein